MACDYFQLDWVNTILAARREQSGLKEFALLELRDISFTALIHSYQKLVIGHFDDLI